METGSSLVNTRGMPEGRFTFTSHDSGDHSICLSVQSAWFTPSSHIRFYLDIVVGNARPDVDHDRSHVSEVASKVRELNGKLEEIRREQQYQREREADFRDLSESTNARAVWYSVAQIVVLILTCAWQLRHLRVSGITTGSNLAIFLREALFYSTSLMTENCDNVHASAG
jgi:p24 family protein alpha